MGKIKSLAGTLAIPASVALAPVLATALGIDIDAHTLEGQLSTAALAVAAGTASAAAALQQNLKASDLLAHRKAEESEANRLANHDIAKAIGKTIATIIALHVGKQAPDSPWAALANDYEATWVTIANTESPDQLGMLQDARILEAIQNNPDAPAFDPVGDQAFWRDILALMAKHADVDPAALASAPEYAAVISALDTRFCYEFYQVLKQDATDGGRAFPGIMLRGMGRALVHLQRIEQRQADHGARLDNITQLLHDVIDRLAGRAAVNPSGNFAVFRAWLKAANHNTVALNANATATERNTAATDTLTRAIIENTAAHRGASPPPPPDNLTAASVPNNAAKFKGRADDLNALHRRVTTDPEGLPIPVIAPPGLGKSALVTRYVYLHQADFDHVWWVRASNPKGNTAGSAEERSLAALLDLWGIESKAIQGDAHTSRIDALAAEVRKWLSRPKADGTPARHLLVLDNVDHYATVKRLRLGAPSRVIFTARAAHLAPDGAKAMNLKALSLHDGLLVLRAKTDRWNAPAHTAALTQMGALVGWNALALTYLAAVLARPSTQSPAALRDTLAAALAAGTTGPLSTPRPHEHPDDHNHRVDEAFDLFIAPYAGTPEMALLDAAALCSPDDIALDLLREASGLDEDAFGAALDELVSAGVLDLDGNSVNIHRLTQVSVRGHMVARGREARPEALTRLLEAMIDLFCWPATQAEELVDHVKTPARLAAVAHAEAVIAHAEMPERDTGVSAAAPLSASSTPALHAKAARLRAEVARRLQAVGQLVDAARHIDAAIAWFETQSTRDEHSLAIWYASRASIRQARCNLVGAEDDIRKSITWGEAQSQRDEHSLAIWYASRASIRQHRGDLVGAEADIQKSIDWGEAQSPRNERSLGIRYDWRARIRRYLGRLQEALDDIDESIRLGERQTPRDDQDMAIRYASRAGIRRDCGDLAGAEADIQRSIDWYKDQSRRDEGSLAFWYETKALIVAKASKFPEAKAAIDESVRLHTAVFGADHEWTQVTIRRQQAIHAGKYPG